MGQRVAVAVANWLGRIRIADEVAFAGWVTPGAFGVPVPCLHVEFGILAIGDGTPPGLKHTIDDGFDEGGVDLALSYAVDSSAERLVGNEAVAHMTGRGIDLDDLSQCKRRNHEKKEASEAHICLGNNLPDEMHGSFAALTMTSSAKVLRCSG